MTKLKNIVFYCLIDMQKNISDLKKKSKPLIALETFSLNVSHKISLMNYCLVTTFSAIFFFLTVKAVLNCSNS